MRVLYRPFITDYNICVWDIQSHHLRAMFIRGKKVGCEAIKKETVPFIKICFKSYFFVIKLRKLFYDQISGKYQVTCCLEEVVQHG